MTDARSMILSKYDFHWQSRGITSFYSSSLSTRLESAWTSFFLFWKSCLILSSCYSIYFAFVNSVYKVLVLFSFGTWWNTSSKSTMLIPYIMDWALNCFLVFLLLMILCMSYSLAAANYSSISSECLFWIRSRQSSISDISTTLFSGSM